MHSPSPTDPTARAPRVPRALSSRALLQLAVAGALTLGGCGGTAGGPAVRVVIPPGASFATATDSLARRHVVGSPKLFRLYAKLTRRDRALKPGTYLLKPGTSWNALLDALTQGKGLVHTLTIPEGWALSQIVPALARSLGAPVESVRVAAADTALRHELDLPTPTLEGYLFPDTYTFPDGTTPRQAVTMMVRRFEQAWTPEWSMRIDTLGMSRHDVVTLASIVEREAKLPEERAVIAAVYVNRLKKGMLLQADPTVQYARGQHTARVMYNDLRIDSPYNTYKHAGLPPGPIGSPGAASLQAALYPANVPYLYFVAFPDGHHEFRATFAEHVAAVSEARRARAAADDNVPTMDSGTGGTTSTPTAKSTSPPTKAAPTTSPTKKRSGAQSTMSGRRTRAPRR